MNFLKNETPHSSSNVPVSDPGPHIYAAQEISHSIMNSFQAELWPEILAQIDLMLRVEMGEVLKRLEDDIREMKDRAAIMDMFLNVNTMVPEIRK